MKDRIEAAQVLKDTKLLPGPLVVDTMTNEAQTLFAAMPERLYIIYEGKVALQGGLGPHNYHVEDLEAWLKKFVMKKK